MVNSLRDHKARGILAACILLALAARPVSSQVWEPTNGPPSGEVISTLILTNGTVLAGTDQKGLFVLPRGGGGWRHVTSPVFEEAEIRALAEFNGAWIVGTGGHGVFSSDDLGESWTPFNVGLESSIVYDLMVSKEGVLYAGTLGGLYQSEAGLEWTLVAGLNAGGGIRAMTENSLGHLFAGVFGLGVARSTDGGLTWDISYDGLVSTVIRSLGVGPSDELYVGTSGGGILQKSVDNGQTWLDANNGLEAVAIWSIAVTDGGTVVAGSLGRGISYSTDGGQSWSSADAPSATVTDIQIADDGSMWAGSEVGILLSVDDGANWWIEGIPHSRVNRVLSVGDRTLAGTYLAGIHYAVTLIPTKGSRRSGAGEFWEWNKTNVDNQNILSIEQGGDDLLYSTSFQGFVYRSDDGGETWTSIWKTFHIPYSATADSRGNVFVATEGGVYTQDGDSAWVLAGLESVHVWMIVIDGNDVLFAGTNGEAIYRSADEGGTWTQIGTEFAGPGQAVGRLRISPSGLLAAAIAPGGGVWVSSDEGDTWSGPGITNGIVISDIAACGVSELCASALIGQVYEWIGPTLEGDWLWSEIGNTFNVAPIRSLTMTNSGVVALGTNRVGVYKSSEPLIPTATEEMLIPSDVRAAVFPNPMSAAGTIEVEVSQPGAARIEIFDAVGRLVRSSVHVSGPGKVRFPIHAAGLSAGVYAVRISGIDGGGRVLVRRFAVVP